MSQLPPAVQLSEMLTAYWTSQAIYVAAKLGIADLLAAGPKTTDELANDTATQPAALYRLLRMLASQGVFAEEGDRRFRQTPLSECLRGDVPGSQKAFATMMGEEHYRASAELLYSVQTGKTAFEKVLGAPVFDYLSKHPEQAAIFDAAMVSVHGRETAAVLDAYDLSNVGLLADVGGGNGSLLIGALTRHAKLKGLLFDLPGVIERAKANVARAGTERSDDVRRRQLFRVGGRGRRRVPHASYHPRLERRAMHDDPARAIRRCATTPGC